MSISTSDILSFVQDAYAASGLTASDIAIALKTCLKDMSTRYLLVSSSDGDDELTTGEYEIETSNFTRFYKVKSLRFVNINDIEQNPCKLIAGGIKGFRQMQADYDGNGIPEYYCEYNGTIYVFKPCNGTYTYLLEYYAHHAWSTEIEFPDEFLLAICYGTCYFRGLLKRNSLYIDHWGPHYFAELEKFRGRI